MNSDHVNNLHQSDDDAIANLKLFFAHAANLIEFDIELHKSIERLINCANPIANFPLNQKDDDLSLFCRATLRYIVAQEELRADNFAVYS